MTYSDFQIDVPRGRTSGEVKCICPQCSHDRRKKHVKCLSVNLDKQVWKCNHCGWVGSLSFGGEKKKTYEIPVWKNTTKLPTQIVDWFQSRNIRQETLNKFKVGAETIFMPQVNERRGTITFPYFRKESIVNVKYRDREKNFRMASKAELIFFNLDALEKYSDQDAFIVEGEIDCLTMDQEGLNRVVSVPNGATLKNNNLQYLDNCWTEFEGIKKIFIATDNDEAGELLADELARRLGVERCYRLKFGDFKDANEAHSNKANLKSFVTTAKPFPIEGLFHVSDFREAYLLLKKNGFPEGWRPDGELGKKLSFHPGYTSVVTGIPSHGKSEFVDQQIISLSAKYDLKAAYFSPENRPPELHLMKMIEKLTGESHRKISAHNENVALNWLDERIMWAYPPDDFSLESILNKIREAVVRFGINLWVLDPWNKLEHKRNSNESMTEYISRSLDMISTFNFKNKTHGFIVAHPTKMKKADGWFEMPTLYDISDSAHWYNKTDLGFVIHKDNDETSYRSIVSVQKVKFKYWGEPGEVSYFWNKDNGRYSEHSAGDFQNWVTKENVAPEISFSRLHNPEDKKNEKDDDIPF